MKKSIHHSQREESLLVALMLLFILLTTVFLFLQISWGKAPSTEEYNANSSESSSSMWVPDGGGDEQSESSESSVSSIDNGTANDASTDVSDTGQGNQQIMTPYLPNTSFFPFQ